MYIPAWILIPMAVYVASITVVLYCQQLELSDRLVVLMLDESEKFGYTFAGLAREAQCSKFRAWIFLTRQRLMFRIESTPIEARDFANLSSYRLNSRGRIHFEPLAI